MVEEGYRLQCSVMQVPVNAGEFNHLYNITYAFLDAHH